MAKYIIADARLGNIVTTNKISEIKGIIKKLKKRASKVLVYRRDKSLED